MSRMNYRNSVDENEMLITTFDTGDKILFLKILYTIILFTRSPIIL